MKLTVGNESVKEHFRKLLGGAVLKGTVYNRWDGVDTHLSLKCDAPEGKVRHLIRNAKAGCFTNGLIEQKVALNSTIELNSKPFA